MLIKRSDPPGGPSPRPAVADSRSVVSGRTMAEIARASGGSSAEPDPAALPGARRGGLPEQPRPQLATLADAAPTNDGWIHEIKFDGYRIMAVVQDGRARLISRNGKDWTQRFPEVARTSHPAGCGIGAAGRRGDRAAAGRHQQLPRAAGSPIRPPYRRSRLPSLRPDPFERRQSRQHAPASAQAGSRSAAGSRWIRRQRRDTLHRAHPRQRGRVSRAGLPDRPGRHRLQTSERTLSEGAEPPVAEGQVRAARGTGDRRLHGPGRFAHGLRRAAARRLRRWRSGVRGQGRHRIRPSASSTR